MFRYSDWAGVFTTTVAFYVLVSADSVGLMFSSKDGPSEDVSDG